MVIKVYIACITCSQEIKKNQQRTLMILESKNIPYTVLDITDPGQEDSKEYMVTNAVPKPGAKIPITPQIFNEADYCGDYDGLDMANECDTLGDFLKMTDDEKKGIKIGITGILPNASKASKEEEATLTNGVASREITSDAPTVELESPSQPAASDSGTNKDAEVIENMEDELTTEPIEKDLEVELTSQVEESYDADKNGLMDSDGLQVEENSPENAEPVSLDRLDELDVRESSEA